MNHESWSTGQDSAWDIAEARLYSWPGGTTDASLDGGASSLVELQAKKEAAAMISASLFIVLFCSGMDAPILSDYHRYLMKNFDNPPAYVQQAQAVDHPDSSPAADSRSWSTRDKILQAAVAASSLFDYAQTQTFLRDKSQWESNPVLGRNPSTGKLAAMVALGQLAHLGISHLLPNPYRNIWQLGTIGVEAGMIANNGNMPNPRRMY